ACAVRYRRTPFRSLAEWKGRTIDQAIRRAGCRAGAQDRMKPISKPCSVLCAFAVLLAGCWSMSTPGNDLPGVWNFTVGPGYQRPGFAAPPRFRFQLSPAEAASLSDLAWWQVFGDRKL